MKASKTTLKSMFFDEFEFRKEFRLKLMVQFLWAFGNSRVPFNLSYMNQAIYGGYLCKPTKKDPRYLEKIGRGLFTIKGGEL